MKRILWLDLETTGLEVDLDHILEVSAIVSDDKLEELGSYDAVISQPHGVLDRMNEWCKDQHFKSGLTKAVLDSSVTLKQAEDSLITLVRTLSSDNKIILAGNSVHFDKGFLKRHMPRLHCLLNYRIIDVSSFKETFDIIFRFSLHKPPEAKHRARQDIEGSIQEFKEYLRFIRVPA